MRHICHLQKIVATRKLKMKLFGSVRGMPAFFGWLDPSLLRSFSPFLVASNFLILCIPVSKISQVVSQHVRRIVPILVAFIVSLIKNGGFIQKNDGTSVVVSIKQLDFPSNDNFTMGPFGFWVPQLADHHWIFPQKKQTSSY